MKKVTPIYYFYPLLMAFLIFLSDFLNTRLFETMLQTFAVWFILSLLIFSLGWIIDKSFGWVVGGKVVFVSIIISIIFSLSFASFFKNYIALTSPLLEDLILFILRNISLGAMGFFGMAIAEVTSNEAIIKAQSEISKNADIMIENAKKEAELLIKEAEQKIEELKKEKLGTVNELVRNEIELKKKLNELITAEKEILNKYDK